MRGIEIAVVTHSNVKQSVQAKTLCFKWEIIAAEKHVLGNNRGNREHVLIQEKTTTFIKQIDARNYKFNVNMLKHQLFQ